MSSADDDPDTQFFEAVIPLPDAAIRARVAHLIGFEDRYEALNRDMRLLMDPEGVKRWAKKQYSIDLPVLETLSERYPLVLFEGDVGTGKTATAEGIADRLARELKKDACLFKLSTRVRGTGTVGQMSSLLNQAFTRVVNEAGGNRLAFLILDEVDSLASERSTEQSHHEDKVAVNTLIQRLDSLRGLGGRVLVIMCTNLVLALDPAVLRRAARTVTFSRPDAEQRRAVLDMELNGMDISQSVIDRLVAMTGPSNERPGFSYSDLRTRLIPDAVGRAYPTRRMTDDDLLLASEATTPSATMAHLPR